MESVNPNDVSLRSANIAFLVNPNGDKKFRYILIVSNIIEFPDKGIFSVNQVRASGHFYDDKPRKIGGKPRLVTTDVRESRMFISDRLIYLPFIWPTDEDMEPYPKIPLNPAGEWNPSHLDDDGQWDDSDENASFGAKVSSAGYTQSEYVLGYILSEP